MSSCYDENQVLVEGAMWTRSGGTEPTVFLSSLLGNKNLGHCESDWKRARSTTEAVACAPKRKNTYIKNLKKKKSWI